MTSLRVHALLATVIGCAPTAAATADAEPDDAGIAPDVLADAPVALPPVASSVSQYGITWTFDHEYPVGQFVTGDWWVVGPVRVISVSPAPQDYDFGGSVGVKRIHGSMINPVGDGRVGYDGRHPLWTPSLSVQLPEDLNAGDSLVSTISLLPSDFANGHYYDLLNAEVGSSGNSYMRTAAILTIVAEVPPPDAFRPAYAGANKTIHRASHLDWSLLPSLSLPPSTTAPSLSAAERMVQRPWIDHGTNFIGRLMHPADDMPNYGRDIMGEVGDLAMLLVLDYTQEQKRNIVLGLVQIGIDTRGVVETNPTIWQVIAGQNFGRKFPVVFAGHMLHETFIEPGAVYAEDCTSYGEEHNPVVQLWTRWQTSGHPYAKNVLYLYVAGLDTNGNPWDHEYYTPAQWHDSPFPNNGNQWPGTKSSLNVDGKHEGYRRISSFAMPGQTIAARILGMQSEWKHDSYFAYVDRWMYENEALQGGVKDQIVAAGWDASTAVPEAGTVWAADVSSLAFAKNMYLHYRAKY